MTVLASKNLTTAKKLPPVGLDLMQEIITCSGVPCLTNCTKLVCASQGIFKLIIHAEFTFSPKINQA